MDGIKEIQNVLETLREMTLMAFPGCTNASFCVDDEGYISITVNKWDDDKKKETKYRKRREMFCQSKVKGEWTKDRSDLMNDYYRECNVLLEEKT